MDIFEKNHGCRDTLEELLGTLLKWLKGRTNHSSLVFFCVINSNHITDKYFTIHGSQLEAKGLSVVK